MMTSFILRVKVEVASLLTTSYKLLGLLLSRKASERRTDVRNGPTVIWNEATIKQQYLCWIRYSDASRGSRSESRISTKASESE